jgi:hypothetical protein
MSPQGFLVAMLLIAMAAISMWRQLLMMAAAFIFIMFCVGLQHVLQIFHSL